MNPKVAAKIFREMTLGSTAKALILERGMGDGSIDPECSMTSSGIPDTNPGEAIAFLQEVAEGLREWASEQVEEDTEKVRKEILLTSGSDERN